MWFPSPSPGPNWEALKEPEPSSDDELDTEDGEVNTPGSARTQRARDGRTEATRNPPLSAPPAFASTSTNAIVGDNSRSQMKRKDFESLFTSKKRVRYQAAHSDQDDAMRFDAYKRTESKTVPVSDPGRSMESASSVGKKIVDKAKAPPKRRRMPSAPQTTRHLSTSKTKAIPSEVIVISDDDDSPPPSISQAKSKKMPIEVIEIFDEPNEVIEIFDSDDEQLPSKAQLEKNVGRSSSDRLQECATESSPRRDQSRHSSLGGDSFEGSGGNADVMNIDGGDLSPSSPRALSQELQVTDDANDNKGNQSFIPLPSSSPSSVGLSPKDNYLSTPPAPTSSITSVTISPPRQQTFPLPTRPNSVKKPITADPSMAGSSSNRLGFSSVAISSSLQAPPPADKHRRQFARKFAIRSMSNEDEDIGESSSEPEGTVNTKANKGKEKEIRESSSSSGTESINMRGLRDALAVDSVMLKQRPVSPTLPKKQGQTLAEAIVSAGQLNRTKKMRPRRLQRSTKDTPVDLASDVEAGDKDGPVDENEKALKAAIGSSRLLVNLLPALKEKSSVSATAAAAKVTESPASSPQGKELPSSPTRMQDFHAKLVPPEPPESPSTKVERSFSYPLSALSPNPNIMAHDVPSEKPQDFHAKLVPPESPSTKVERSSYPLSALSPNPNIMAHDMPSEKPQDFHAKLVPPESPSTNVERSSYPLSALSPNPNIMAHDMPSEKPLLSLEMKLESASSGGKIFGTAAEPKTEPSTAFEFKSGTALIGPHETADLEAIQTSITPLSIHPPASPIVPTSSNDAAIQDVSFDTLGLPSDDLPSDDEDECQTLLQGSNMDVIPSHEVQSSVQDSIVVRHMSHIDLDMSVAAPSPLKSLSATTTEVFNEKTSVSPPIPEVSTRRSSRLSSSRSSRSASIEGLGIAFDFDSGPSNSVPVSRTSTPEVHELSALPFPAKTYGGFRALTWKDFRKDLNNFSPKTYYAKNLPHALQDHINSMSEYTQMMEGMRDLFKATILENTVEDEPDAPPIEIWNSVDTQSTPPWEFYYTNNMWLGEGVPPPDIKTLLSCTCKGGCNPKSKTCACLLRQREATGDPLLEFAYDKNGRLKIPGYPIFECNDLCGCSDECRNRVVQQGRKVPVSIGKTEMKGWGVFAGSKKIPEGTFIGIYSGELLTDAEAHERGIKYNKSGRTYLFDIDFHHLRDGSPLWENNFTVDAYHAGNFTRFLNHSCDPNCRLYACYINEGNIQKPLLAVFTRRDVEPYEEICFNYQGLYDDDDDDEGDDSVLDPDHGKDMIYVRCRCGAKNCTGTMFK